MLDLVVVVGVGVVDDELKFFIGVFYKLAFEGFFFGFGGLG